MNTNEPSIEELITAKELAEREAIAIMTPLELMINNARRQGKLNPIAAVVNWNLFNNPQYWVKEE